MKFRSMIRCLALLLCICTLFGCAAQAPAAVSTPVDTSSAPQTDTPAVSDPGSDGQTPEKEAKVQALWERTGGFLTGVGYYNRDAETEPTLLAASLSDPFVTAGFGWVRSEMPAPFTADGSFSQDFLSFKADCEAFLAKGLRVMAATPNPAVFLAAGMDSRTEDGMAAVEDACRRIAEELADCVACFQIAGNLRLEMLRNPFEEDDITDFLIACTRGVRAGAPDALIGNGSGFSPLVELNAGRSDFIALECYANYWENGGLDEILQEIKSLCLTSDHTPVILTECGVSFSENPDEHVTGLLAALQESPYLAGAVLCTLDCRVEALMEKTGGLMAGICHPRGEKDGLLEAGLTWIRFDVPYPFNADGSFTQAFLDYKTTCEEYLARGIRTIAVTLYPASFIAAGIDPRTPEGLAETEAVCKRMAEELAHCVDCWQICNEMWVVHFRKPLTEEESVDYLIACTKGVRAGDPDGIIGNNSWYLPELEEAAGRSDYIGLDSYTGTWADGEPDDVLKNVQNLYLSSNRTPVILMECGFNSSGDIAEDMDAEIDAYLKSLGFNGRLDAANRLDEFIATLPEVVQWVVNNASPEDRESAAFGYWTHLLKKWSAKSDIPHTDEGQAEYYRQLLPQVLHSPFLAGSVFYCWQDSAICGNCGSADCPCETTWGITRVDGTRKPAYDVIRSYLNP